VAPVTMRTWHTPKSTDKACGCLLLMACRWWPAVDGLSLMACRRWPTVDGLLNDSSLYFPFSINECIASRSIVPIGCDHKLWCYDCDGTGTRPVE
jgi:hypothetical protein